MKCDTTVQANRFNGKRNETSEISNKNKRRILCKELIIATALFAVQLLAGCQKAGTKGVNNTDTTKSFNKAEDTITVGIDRFEPYTYLDENGDYTGIDIELAKEAFGKLGYEPNFQVIDWEDKDEYLKDGTIDCIWSCYSMTDREDKYEWAGPYMYSRQVVVVRADSGIKTLDDLENKRIGVQTTTKAENLFLHMIDSPLPENLQVNSFSTTDELFAILRKNYVDAISGHEALLVELVNSSPETYLMLDESPYMSQIGVAFEKGTHEELAENLTETLENMAAEGTVGEIAKKYGLDPEKAVFGGNTDEK